jgi:hypothetical protein
MFHFSHLASVDDTVSYLRPTYQGTQFQFTPRIIIHVKKHLLLSGICLAFRAHLVYDSGYVIRMEAILQKYNRMFEFHTGVRITAAELPMLEETTA